MNEREVTYFLKVVCRWSSAGSSWKRNAGNRLALVYQNRERTGVPGRGSPAGVVGEIEYEVDAFLRNPFERPELFLSRATIERRLKQFTSELNLDFERALAWHEVQLVNYLTATRVDHGLALNFGPSVQVKRKFREYKPKGSLMNRERYGQDLQD